MVCIFIKRSEEFEKKIKSMSQTQRKKRESFNNELVMR